ncbi:MAG: hypothetical protein LBH61_06660 [Dysgonamonadaceae bacterium]|jgi:hypothetical protein|nr:hypothetical protein [Dysgonamonadaceae bacterium]
MKTYNKFSAILMGAILLTGASCTEEVFRSASPVQEGGVQVYISEANSTSLLFLPDDPTTFTVTLGRQNTQGTITVPLSVSDPENLLAVNNSITFEDGEALAELEVDFSAMELGQSTSLELSVTNEEDRYLYGLSTLSIRVLRDYKWASAGSVEYTDLDFGLETATVPIERAEGTQLFRLPNLFYEICVAVGDPDPVDKGYHLQFYIDPSTYDAISLVDGFQDLGTGYEVYWNTGNFGDYCHFTNYGSKYTLEYILTPDRSTVYLGGASFVWTDGFKGVEPDPYKDEDLEKANLDKVMTDAEGYYLGYEYQDGQDEYGNKSEIPVAEYILSLASSDLDISLDILTSFDGNIVIPAGVYPIDNSDEATSVRAGNYTEFPYGSYAQIPAISPDLKLYFVSGAVRFEYEGDICNITVEAVTGKGSNVKATWQGKLDIIDLTQPEPAGAKMKADQKPKKAKLSLIK